MPALRTLLNGLIDYAGLFPPAKLDLAIAAAQYASYRTGDENWALGRFIIPASRLTELGTILASSHLPPDAAPWKLSAIAGTDLGIDLLTIDQFNRSARGRAVVDTIELRPCGAATVASALKSTAGRLETYVEIHAANDPAGVIGVVAQGGGRAKIRTGGVTADDFPEPRQVMRFLRRCQDAGLSFKATAGLHHPLRSAHRLTYDPDSGCALMFGFLNVFLAAAFLEQGMADDEALVLLEESSPQNLRFDDDAVLWRSHRLGDADLAQARRRAAAFGSCSFREPMDDLRAMRFL